MVTLAPMKSNRRRPNNRLIVDQAGDPGHRPVVQPKFVNPYGVGISDMIRRDITVEETPESWEPKMAEPWTGSNVFQVSVPGQPISMIPADDEHVAKARYNQLNGIIQSDLPYDVVMVGGGEKRGRVKKSKADDPPLIDQLDD